jgi:SP family myo-inositol transporter-like MFS transporter 13
MADYRPDRPPSDHALHGAAHGARAAGHGLLLWAWVLGADDPLTLELTRDTGGVLVPGTDYPRSQALLVLVSMMLFVAAYATGSGNIPWQQGELFPLEVRGLGTSLCTATNWSANLLVAATFLSLMEAATPAGAFALYAFVCVVGWVFIWRCYPETSGLSLEEVSEVFADDFGVRKSEVMRRAKGVSAAQV